VDRSARIVVADTGNRRVAAILDALPVRPLSSVVITGPTMGVTQTDYTFTAAVSPITVTWPVTYVWRATGQSVVTNTDGLRNTTTFMWAMPGTQAITVTATNVANAVTGTYAIIIREPRVPETSIIKTVIPQGQVSYGDELTYTLVISTVVDMPVGLYDPLEGTTFTRFVERPTGVICSDDTITGTLTVTPTNQITVSFVVQVDTSGTAGVTVDVTNSARICPIGGTLGDCVWSNEVTNPAFQPYSIYLPLVVRNDSTR
jgi:hypothetical protein